MIHYKREMKEHDPNIDKEAKEAERLRAWADKEAKKLKEHKKELRKMIKEEHKEWKKEEEIKSAEAFDKAHSNPDEIDQRLAWLAANEERQE